jgi:hypothetical protein
MNIQIVSMVSLKYSFFMSSHLTIITLLPFEHKKSTTYGVKNLVSGLGYKPIIEIPYGWEDLSAPLMLTRTQNTQSQRNVLCPLRFQRNVHYDFKEKAIFSAI